MAQDFSVKKNDKTAAAVASRLMGRFFVQNTLRPGYTALSLMSYLSEYAGLAYEDTMRLLRSLHIDPEGLTPPDVLRLSYALIHVDAAKIGSIENMETKTVKADAKILNVTVDKLTSANPVITFHCLVVSSLFAGRMLLYTVNLKEAVRLQRSVYCGRALKYAGRSLLEFVGCVCQLTIGQHKVLGMSSTPEHRKLNKELCVSRCKMEGECPKAQNCVLCNERRSTCRLAVRI